MIQLLQQPVNLDWLIVMQDLEHSSTNCHSTNSEALFNCVACNTSILSNES